MIVILGKTGYVAKRFAEFFNKKGIEFVATSMRTPSDRQNIISFIEYKKFHIHAIINCVGYTGVPNVDACETNQKDCLYLNSVFAEEMAGMAKFFDIPFIHISSGCIYDKMNNVNEAIAPNFSFYGGAKCSFYSGTKALGESLVRKTYDRHYILRVRMPFNNIDDDKNYISKLLKYDKVWSAENSLTNIDEFVAKTYDIIRKKIPYGTYNMVNSGSVDAKQILAIAKQYGIVKSVYDYFESEEDFNKVILAPRSNCTLSTEKCKRFDIEMSNVELSIINCFKSWNRKDITIYW